MGHTASLFRPVMAIACAVLFWASAACADCTQPATDFDSGVCDAQDYLTADEAMNEAYQQLMASLSADAQLQQRQSELDWMQRRDKDCTVILDGKTYINFGCAAVIERQHTQALLADLAQQPYAGAGDLVPGATAYYGLRAYNTAYAAPGSNKAVQLRRASDDATKDIAILKSGALDISTASAFCAGTSCYVAKWYDQTGHGNDVEQDDPHAQPQFLPNGFNGHPSVQFSYANSTYLSGWFRWVSGNQPWSSQAVLLSLAPTDWYEPVFDYGTMTSNSSLFALVHYSSSVYDFGVSVYNNDLPSDIPSSAPAAVTFLSTGDNVGGYVNGTGWTRPFGGAAIMGDRFNIGGSPEQSGIWLNGSLGEVILYNSALSADQAQRLEVGERRYFGF
jgi:uncharacterized protein YecT (DUF1311 family)